MKSDSKENEQLKRKIAHNGQRVKRVRRMVYEVKQIAFNEELLMRLMRFNT